MVVTPDGSTIYVARPNFGDVLVINALTYQVIGNIVTGVARGIAISPDGSTLYAASSSNNSVSVIDTSTNTVRATVLNVPAPYGTSVTPDGARLYVANGSSNTVTVIDTGTNTILGSIPTGSNPFAFGNFIQPLPKFAGRPGATDCQGVSVSTLATKYGGLNNAAAAFGFGKVQGLQDAIRAFCHRTTS